MFTVDSSETHENRHENNACTKPGETKWRKSRWRGQRRQSLQPLDALLQMNTPPKLTNTCCCVHQISERLMFYPPIQHSYVQILPSFSLLTLTLNPNKKSAIFPRNVLIHSLLDGPFLIRRPTYIPLLPPRSEIGRCDRVV